ncbi:hypothetical protein GW17_00045824 [Ensete ventricosum]|nr:hypothetical protein GW17_00045824 [Ensete ventricosum]
MTYFYFDFHYACDALAEVSQRWYQSQVKAAMRRGGQPRPAPMQGRLPATRLQGGRSSATSLPLAQGQWRRQRRRGREGEG